MRSDPHMNAFEDPYVFTATSSDAPLISETVGHDEFWNGIAEGDDEYSDVDAQVKFARLIRCLMDAVSLLDGLMRVTDVMVDGKIDVVAG
ncbi:hypothetical protein C5167_004467 [Papaver somniferum]|uniref:Uncharacterized protein n=1 Tax=Papaver somniferum TaxID=3469 RepID=A0A4Y7J9K0_PAPSO|nr:hypothetical protein C5167_004467 [Papaver somniferum]